MEKIMENILTYNNTYNGSTPLFDNHVLFNETAQKKVIIKNIINNLKNMSYDKRRDFLLDFFCEVSIYPFSDICNEPVISLMSKLEMAMNKVFILDGILSNVKHSH